GDFVIADLMNKRIQIFDKDYKYVSHIQLNQVLSPYYYVRIDSKDRIFANLPNRDSLFAVLNLDGDELEKFGDIFDYKLERWIYDHNKVHYDFDEDYNLYCAFVNHAVLRKYDKDFNLVYEKDYSFLPPVQERSELWEKGIEKRGGMENYNGYLFKNFITFFSVDEKRIYIRCLDRHIYVFDKDNATLIKKIFLNAPEGGSAGSLFDCSSQDHIYTARGGLVAKFKK
ncbi:hypothetical protein AMJ80_12520, partial [bacterium SM23_31]